LTRLKQKANWGIACDPSFMDDLPSEHYFASARSTKLKNIYPNSFPSAYSLS